MADDSWPSRNFDEITQKLTDIKAAVAHDLSTRYKAMGAEVSQACAAVQEVRNRLNDDRFWSGQGPSAAHSAVDSFYKTVDDPDTGLPALADKISATLDQDADVLTQANAVPQSHSRPNSKATLEEWNKATEELRADAQRLYTTPLDVQRPNVTDVGKTKTLPETSTPLPGNGGTQTGGSTGGGGGGTQSPSVTDGLANKDTKPQLAGSEGQQGGGAGQGQGGGQGGGSGGGAPGGGSGSGAGSGFGAGSKDPGSGLPVGGTTAAGFSPSATGTGPGGSVSGAGGPGGLSVPRGGGLPGGVAGGTGPGGVNPAGIGAAGVRGGGGPIGMMGGAGAHGAHGKGQDDDEKPIPNYLINVDNGNELFGEPVKASPGVIGDWTENEQAEKQAREAEKRRYKSMGWDVRFSDEEEGRAGGHDG